MEGKSHEKVDETETTAIDAPCNGEDVEVTELHSLGENAILLHNLKEEKQLPPKPPPTPEELISDCYVTILPTFPENIDDIEIPYVREVGVRDAIGVLAPFFKCNNFENNPVQFWFLDIIVDCIWKAQDEFRFALAEQKYTLEWLLFVLKLISSSNMTKELVFQIFNEAMTIAEDYINSGGLELPFPSKLFINKVESNINEEISISSLHTSSLVDDPQSRISLNPELSKQYIVVNANTGYEVYKLPKKDMPIDCISSSVDSMSEQNFRVNEPPEDVIDVQSDYSVNSFKVDMSTPSRFKSLEDLNKTGTGESSLNYSRDSHESSSSSSRTIGDWHNVPRQRSLPICPSKIITERNNLPVIEEKLEISEVRSKSRSKVTLNVADPYVPTSDEIFKLFYDINMWKLKHDLMDSSGIGWTSLQASLHQPKEQDNVASFSTNNRSAEDERQYFIKSCVLMAVRQIVFEYFENTFSFELARISLTQPQFFITQDINVEWNIPKDIKGELKKPVIKKTKKKNLKKEPKSKDKKDKSKTSTNKAKNEKDKKSKSDKKSKADKKSQADKKSKADKKTKPEKKGKSLKGDKDQKLSKEEKIEFENQRKQQESLQKDLLQQTENKMFMFPLKDAVDDDFFIKLFPNFKSKKGGGVKSEKLSKSSKGSKGSKDPKGSKGKKSKK